MKMCVHVVMLLVLTVIAHTWASLSLTNSRWFRGGVQKNGRVAPTTDTIPSTSSLAGALVICGPSGVGKGTIIDALLHLYPETFALSVSHTSRAPRPGEINGTHYYFTTRGHIERCISEDPTSFIETAEVHGNLYGTSLQAIKDVQKLGKVCILDVDTEGVVSFRERAAAALLSVRYLFIAAPSRGVLEQRLRARGSESEHELRTRLDNAVAQEKFGRNSGYFDLVVVNFKLDDSVQCVLSHLRKWFPTYFRH